MSALSLITDYAWCVCQLCVLILSSLRPCLATAVVTGSQVKSVLIKFCLFFDSSNINRLTRNIQPEAPTTDKLLYYRESSTDMSLLPSPPGGVENVKHEWMPNLTLPDVAGMHHQYSISSSFSFTLSASTLMKCVYTISLSAPSQSAFKWFHKLQPQILNKFKRRLGKPNI